MFTDLLDNYLLCLGEFNQAYMAYVRDAFLYGQQYRDAQAKLIAAKNSLNEFFEPITEP
jgi:hypothetical protein